MTDNTQPTLHDIVKGTPEGDEAIQKALIGAARDQEAVRAQAKLRKEIDIIVGNPLNRVRDTNAIVELVTAYTNKQIEAVLDRLEDGLVAERMRLNVERNKILKGDK